MLDKNIEDFVMRVSFLEWKIIIHLAREAQIALLLAKELNVLVKYSDFADIFSEKSKNVFLEQTIVNGHAIKFEESKQPVYRPIYSRKPFELRTFKTYIETNLVNNFIRASKSPAGALILFLCKLNDSLCLCVNYQGLNNLTIKNWYLLLLIGKSLDWLGWAKQFIQLDLTCAYYQMRIKEVDEWKMAFRTWYDHFEYQVMLFRLSNASASFQYYINKILAKKLDIFVIVYLDNILIYTEDLG